MLPRGPGKKWKIPAPIPYKKLLSNQNCYWVEAITSRLETIASNKDTTNVTNTSPRAPRSPRPHPRGRNWRTFWSTPTRNGTGRWRDGLMVDGGWSSSTMESVCQRETCKSPCQKTPKSHEITRNGPGFARIEDDRSKESNLWGISGFKKNRKTLSLINGLNEHITLNAHRNHLAPSVPGLSSTG